MKAINLYILTRNKDSNYFEIYENTLSNSKQRVKSHEMYSLNSLVDILELYDVGIKEWEGFYYGYKIEQIGKEFDLLKISKGVEVLNIELKSDMVGLDKIEKQLQRNCYYLKHLAPSINLFTYISSNKELYKLNNNNLVKCDFHELIVCLKKIKSFESGNLNDLFKPKDYLISPINSPQQFVDHEFFLTNQQEEIKKSIFEMIKKGNRLFGIKGEAGTGKTLLLYEIAYECSLVEKVLMIHCGIMSDGHKILNGLIKNLNIIEAKMIPEFRNKFNEYHYIFVDEVHRIYPNYLDIILNSSKLYNIPCFFAYDYRQRLSHFEEINNIPKKLYEIENFQEKKLTSKIRTNKEITSFIRQLLRLEDRPKTKRNYNNIEVLWASNIEEATQIITYYQKEKNYIFIEYTKSLYRRNLIDRYNGDINTHKAIGQEFDNVLVIMDRNFLYDTENVLRGKEHPNPDYYFARLFYQAITRARERLCIVILNNKNLYDNILKIKNEGM